MCLVDINYLIPDTRASIIYFSIPSFKNRCTFQPCFERGLHTACCILDALPPKWLCVYFYLGSPCSHIFQVRENYSDGVMMCLLGFLISCRSNRLFDIWSDLIELFLRAILFRRWFQYWIIVTNAVFSKALRFMAFSLNRVDASKAYLLSKYRCPVKNGNILTVYY